MINEDDDHNWLPSLIPYADFNGQWEPYEQAIYDLFERDFIKSQPIFNGKRVSINKDPKQKGKEAGFWHLTSEGPIEADRTPDFRRCERIAWIRASIDEASRNNSRVFVWTSRSQPRREDRVVLALRDFSFVVILAERPKYCILITAFFIERGHQRQKYRKQYEDWCREQKEKG